MNLILLEPADIGSDGIARLDGARAQHIRKVLAAVEGQSIRIGLLNGPTGTGRVITSGESGVSLHCTLDAQPSVPPVDLLLALPRPKVLRRLWAQVAAMGVRRIMVTNAERVERQYFDTHVLSEHGYRPLLVEGLQQARDTHLPLVTVHRQFRILIEDHLDAMVGPSRRLVADPAGRTPVTAAVRTGGADRILLAVGPEGGWNTFELDLLRAHGFECVTMGARTLRVDTACIALLALVHDALASPSEANA